MCSGLDVLSLYATITYFTKTPVENLAVVQSVLVTPAHSVLTVHLTDLGDGPVVRRRLLPAPGQARDWDRLPSS